MKILQKRVSEIHQSAFFYHGEIASEGNVKLQTEQDGEIMYDGGDTMKTYVGAETPKLATETDICDSDIENEDIVEIYVDKFFAISVDGVVLDEGELYFNNYDEAIEEFKIFLERI